MIDLGGRHDVRLVKRRDGAGVVRKSAPREAARREADALRAVAGLGVAPRLLRHDARRGITQQQAVAGATLAQRARVAGLPDGVGAALGAARARVHATPPPTHDAPRPMGVTLGLPHADILDATSPGSLAIARLAQCDAPLRATLDGCNAAWLGDARIHNDVRPQNVLVRGRRVALVDWELSGAGDAAWDVGSAVGILLGAWVLGMPLAPGLDARASSSLSSVPWDRALAEAHAAWDAYDAAAPGLARDRVARMAIARLAQSACEAAQRDLAPGAHALRLLQLAASLALDADGILEDGA